MIETHLTVHFDTNINQTFHTFEQFYEHILLD